MSQAGLINLTGGGGGGPIETIDGDTGYVTGSTVTIKAGVSTQNCGSTVQFVGNDTTTMTMNVTDSNRNTIIGKSAGNASVTGNDNTFLGTDAGLALTSGIENCGVGYGCLDGVTSGSTNTAIGGGAINGITTGSSNIGLGWEAAQNLTTGSDNIFLGVQAGVNYTSSESNNILIGNAGVLSESNVIRIGKQGNSTGEQNTAYMAGITGVTAVGSPVAVNASTGQLSDLGFGTATQVLTSNGAGVSPTWQAAGGGGSFNGFLAYLSANATNVTGDGTVYTVAFNSTSYNTGSNFNTGTYTYTAPTTGVYQFGGAIYGFGYGAGHTQQTINLITTATTFAMYTVNPYLMSGNGTLVVPFSQQCHMTAGDTANITVDVTTSTKTIGIGGLLGLSSFWGQFLG